MLFSNLSQFVVLGLVFFIGLIFAFVVHPGGRKWKKLYQEEIEDNASWRSDADSEIRAARRRIAELERDKAALEQQLAEAAAAPAAVTSVTPEPEPVSPEPVIEATPVEAEKVPAAVLTEVPAAFVAEAAPATEAEAALASEVEVETPLAVVDEVPPAEAPVIAAPAPITDEAKKAWLGAAGYHDLTRIRGIDGVLNTRLFGLGITRFGDIEKLSAEDEIALEQRLNVPAGFIARERWREQAALLRAGNVTEHSQRFGAADAFA